MPREPPVEPVDLGPLLAEPLGVQAVDHRHPLRVVGDGDVLQSRGPWPPRPSPRCVARPSVQVLCMCRSPRMSSSSTSRGSSARRGPLELAAGPRGSRAGSRAGRARAYTSSSRPPGDLLLAAEDAVFVDLQAAVLGQPAEHDVVGLRAGEVLQRRAERLGRHDAEVELQAAGQPGRHLRLRRGPSPRPGRAKPARWSITAAASRGHGQEVQVADRLLAAAVAAGGLDLLDGRRSPACGPGSPGRSGRPRPRAPAARPRRRTPGLGGSTPRSSRRNPSGRGPGAPRTPARSSSSVLTPSSLCSAATRFGPRPGTRISASTLSGTCCSSSSSIGSEPLSRSVAIFSARSLPMPSRSVSLPLGIGGDLGHRLGQIADRAGGVAIGPDAERVGVLEFQEVGDLVEDVGDFGVGHGDRVPTCAVPPRPCRAARSRP